MFSLDWIGCAWLLLSVSLEKCSLISSELAARQGQGSIDNQSILQLVNCPGSWLGASGALSTSAGRDKSSLCLFFPSSCFSFSFFSRVSDPLHECKTELAFTAQWGDCSYFTTLTRLHISFCNWCVVLKSVLLFLIVSGSVKVFGNDIVVTALSRTHTDTLETSFSSLRLLVLSV